MGSPFSLAARCLPTSACARLAVTFNQMGVEPSLDIAYAVQHRRAVGADLYVLGPATLHAPIGERAGADAEHPCGRSVGDRDLLLRKDSLVVILNVHNPCHENASQRQARRRLRRAAELGGAPIGHDTRARAPQRAELVAPRADLWRSNGPAWPARVWCAGRGVGRLSSPGNLLRGHGRPHMHPVITHRGVIARGHKRLIRTYPDERRWSNGAQSAKIDRRLPGRPTGRARSGTPPSPSLLLGQKSTRKLHEVPNSMTRGPRRGLVAAMAARLPPCPQNGRHPFRLRLGAQGCPGSLGSPSRQGITDEVHGGIA